MKANGQVMRWTMIDHDFSSENPPIKGKAGRALPHHLRVRLSLALAASCLFLLALYPWGGEFYPEGEWYRGPLCLFGSQSLEDKITGGIVATILTPLIFAFFVRPGCFAVVLSIAGTLAWLGFGIWLALLASV
jgi:hypothetical protein